MSATTPNPITVRQAGPLLRAIWRPWGMVGWCSPWGVVYVHPSRAGDRRLIAHEQEHARQMQRDGVVLFHLRYLHWTFKYGYHANPYEVAARAAVATATTA